jgi:hypothetical protein
MASAQAKNETGGWPLSPVPEQRINGRHERRGARLLKRKQPSIDIDNARYLLKPKRELKQGNELALSLVT